MSVLHFTIEGANARLDVFERYCTVRENKTDGRIRTINYKDVSHVELHEKQNQSDGYICFSLRMANG